MAYFSMIGVIAASVIAFNLVSSAAKTLVAAQAESKTADKILIPTLFITIILQIEMATKTSAKAHGEDVYSRYFPITNDDISQQPQENLMHVARKWAAVPGE
jgi:Na+-transporting NADH:ubiquinone oxidoreductase subunit NqrC